MSKIIQDGRLVGEYPGLTRTIEVRDGNRIAIEFNQMYSNEIGVRFEKMFTDGNLENEILKVYFANSLPVIDEAIVTEELVVSSLLQLWEDTLHDTVFLPDNNYVFFDDKSQLLANINYVKTRKAKN